MNGAPVYTRGNMPSHLKRYHTLGHNHFVTFSCYHRLPYLDNDHARTVFLDTLERTRQKHPFYVFGGWHTYVLCYTRGRNLMIPLKRPPVLQTNTPTLNRSDASSYPCRRATSFDLESWIQSRLFDANEDDKYT